MRDAFKIYDTDTHGGWTAESIEPYLTGRVRELVPDLDEFRRPITASHSGQPLEPPFRHRYAFEAAIGGWSEKAGGKPRVLGEAAPREDRSKKTGFMGAKHPSEDGYEIAAARLSDMDTEGTDVHTIVSQVPRTANPELEVELIQAHHRWLDDFCTTDPARLKGLVVISPVDIDLSVREIHKWGPSRWAVGIHPSLPVGYPIDHPDLDPIWAAAAEEGLVLVHHSFSQGYPGYRDLWDSPFLGRSASHPWGAMRFVGAVTGSGMLDRHSELRFAILESGFGWLPFWSRRLDEQAEYVGYVAPDLKHKPSEYLSSGRFFASAEFHEGGEAMKWVFDQLGEGVLMLGSDYPHSECRFPDSPGAYLAWRSDGVTDTQMQKLMWENAVNCFGQP